MSEITYLSSYVPKVSRPSRSTKTTWAGLNRQNTQDTGEISDGRNVFMRDYPFISSAKGASEKWLPPEGHKIVSLHSTGENSFVVITHYEGRLYFNYVADENTVFTDDFADYEEGVVPSVAAFNTYSGASNNIVAATYTRRILVYPYCISFDPNATTPSLSSFNTSGNSVPKLDKVVVYGGRVFGVLKGKFYASEWNNYAGWRLNTATNTSTDLAWVSTTQSDIDASGEFTAIAAYDNHVIGFKRNFMHMIYNNKAPFRIVDIAKIGALSQEAVCICGQKLFFVSDDGVYVFGGGYPSRISDKLNVKDYDGAVLGCDDSTVYCYVPSENTVFTYDTVYNVWGSVDGAPKMCTTIVNDCYYATEDAVYCFGDGDYGEFFLETDSTMGGALAEKKINRLRVQASHPSHSEGDYLCIEAVRGDGSVALTKNYYPTHDGDYVYSMLTRMTCDFGVKIRISGHGEWKIKYLQIDYSSGGESYV